MFYVKMVGSPRQVKNGEKPVKVNLTTGYGHLLTDAESRNPDIMKKYGEGLSKEEANALFDVDTGPGNGSRLGSAWNRDKEVNYTLTQNQFDAVFSLIFNSGSGSFVNSDLWDVMSKNPYNYDSIEKRFLNYNINGKNQKGVADRRLAEWRVYRCAEYRLKNGQLISGSTMCKNS